MKEFTIGKNEAGQRLDKYLHKLLPEAGTGFLYKMLRKKNIVVNGKKSDGSEKLNEGDVLRLYFADETFEKFANPAIIRLLQQKETNSDGEMSEYRKLAADKLDIIYEDEDILLMNKPSGMLSQKAKPSDISANEYLLAYLIQSGQLKESELATFRPSVCNRLDRNTSGLLTAGKSLKGLQTLSEMLKERSVRKFYRCIVAGCIQESAEVKGWLIKDVKSNQVTILDKKQPDAKYIETAYRPVQTGNKATLLEVHLITGRSHQIRAHLASLGHPIIGDPKYGNPRVNDYYQKQYKVKSQLLHAYRMEFTDGSSYVAPLPREFDRILADFRNHAGT